MQSRSLRFYCKIGLAAAAAGSTCAAAQQSEPVDEVVVFGEGPAGGQSGRGSPTSLVTPEDLVSINAATTEDLVKYEPGLVIRRRYIGDPNGTMGMRGSNMFQTARSMVFADGLPLHYFLQTQYNGSPRWSLVAADEVGFIEVIYGPFSAEYSGNAMGGVVNIETTIPTERRFHVEGSLFQQSFDEQGFDEGMNGSRIFASYGDKLGGLSVYTAYSRLENDSQPLDYLFAGAAPPAGGETPVTGSRVATDEYGDDVRYFGNTGSQSSTTDQIKTKIGYEWGDWFALGNVAYERRAVGRDSVQNYLWDDATGAGSDARIWSGTVVDEGMAFGISGSDFAVDYQDRSSLLAGGRLQGPLTENWAVEAGVSYFEILKDVTRTSDRNPSDPAFTPAGNVTRFDDTGWRTAELKLRNDKLFASDRWNIVTGYRYERFSLELDNYDSNDFAAGATTSLANASGGTTDVHALYAQIGWNVSDEWDVELGGRYESWTSRHGFYHDHARGRLQDHGNREEDRFSPKLSVGFAPDDDWRFRYSLAQAYRFPIVEELFQNERRTRGTSIADASLAPEDGLHQNLMLERGIDGGYVRVNLFGERIDDVIFNQSAIVDNGLVTTFLPIDRVRTHGAEIIYNQVDAWRNVDIRFNAAYVDSKIDENVLDRSLEGNVFPRMPDWRAHLLVTYHAAPRWDVGGGMRYSADSFGDLDNTDTASRVFGAHDAYTQLNVRASYRWTSSTTLHVGIDNVTDEITYVHHPWPGRTFFVDASFDF